MFDDSSWLEGIEFLIDTACQTDGREHHWRGIQHELSGIELRWRHHEPAGARDAKFPIVLRGQCRLRVAHRSVRERPASAGDVRGIPA